MEKLVYVVWREPDGDPGAVAQRLLDDVAPGLVGLGAGKVRLFVEDPEAAASFRYGAAPDGGVLAGTVSFWLDSVDRRSPFEALLPDAAGYLVTESVPREHSDRHWPDGERSPGISLVSMFDRRHDVADDDLYREWHGIHTPMSFEVHPLTLYIRNVVARPLTAGAPPLKGIVQEAVPSLDHLLDPYLFYSAGPERDRAVMKHNIERANANLAAFADMATMQACAMAEYIVTSS